MSTTTPFQPKGVVSEAEILYREIRSLNVGDILTYQRLDNLLGRSFRKERGPFYIALKRLESNNMKTLECVRGQGYQVVPPTGHEKLARHHETKARRQVVKSRSKLTSADPNGLPPAVRDKLHQWNLRLGRIEDSLRHHDRRLDEAEKAIAEAREQARTAVTAEQLQRLIDGLRRQGITVDTEVTEN